MCSVSTERRKIDTLSLSAQRSSLDERSYLVTAKLTCARIFPESRDRWRFFIVKYEKCMPSDEVFPKPASYNHSQLVFFSIASGGHSEVSGRGLFVPFLVMYVFFIFEAM